MDVVTLARWQFGITTVYHFIMVPLTIGLSLVVAWFQTRWYRPGDEAFLRLTKFFGKLMLINFAMGVVTGILAANSWMQHPVGVRFNPESGRAEIPVVVAAISLVLSLAADRSGRDGLAFAASGVAIAAAVVALFGSLYPDVMPSTTSPAFSLTVDNASSTAYTLRVMTWVAVPLTPVVIAYQAWSYWVFRRRISAEHIPAVSVPPSV